MTILSLNWRFPDFAKVQFKGSGEAAELIGLCNANEMPEFIVSTLTEIQALADPESDNDGAED